MGYRRAGIVLLSLVAAASVPAMAEDCGPLKMQASLPLTTTPNRERFFVPVTINGVAKMMLLDTGGVFSELTPEAVQELNLPRHDVRLKQFDVSGKASREAALASSFDMDTLQGSNVEFMIGADQNMFANNSSIAGILAPNVLYYYDVDIDFGAARLNLMSQDHCEGKVIYWHPGTVAVVPMRVAKSHHIVVPVTLDGHPYNAVLDTGAPDSALNLNAAEDDFGLKIGSPDMKEIGRLHDRAGSAIYQHAFQTLSFEGISVSNPIMEIVPDLTKGLETRAPQTGTRIADNDEAQGLPDLLIGMDVLRHLHLYIAYKEQKLYITLTEAPVTGKTSSAAGSSAPTATH